jgi:FkbM family methyltransferase
LAHFDVMSFDVMSFRSRLIWPEYFYRALWSDLWSDFPSSRVRFIDARTAIVHLPWRLDIMVNHREALGKALIGMGVYNLAVSEALWRLIKKDARVVDVGANIGYMTSIMAVRAGEHGQTVAFEPHPVLADATFSNVRLWARNMNEVSLSEITVRTEAVGATDCESYLHVPQEFTYDNGAAFVSGEPALNSLKVSCKRLDSTLANWPEIDLLKVTVGGGELAVFRGALNLLSHHRIRNVIFQVQGDSPTPETSLFDDLGYTMFQLGIGAFGPLLGHGNRINATPRRDGEPRSMLASLEPEVAIAAFAARGWRVLSPGRSTYPKRSSENRARS